jgi:hypothetical protein
MKAVSKGTAFLFSGEEHVFLSVQKFFCCANWEMDDVAINEIMEFFS